MKKFAVLGAGLMGKVAVKDLLDSEPECAVTLIDFDKNLLQEVNESFNINRLSTSCLDITNEDEAIASLKGHNSAVDCLPISLAMHGMAASVKASVPIASLNGEKPEEKIKLDGLAKTHNTCIVPGIGVAPGMSHVFVGRGVELLDTATHAFIYVGGLPKNKKPPLEYSTVYSLDSVLYYYMEPAKILENGLEKQVEALTGIETIAFDEPIGQLEAFYTDGLTSLTMTMKNKISELLTEKTLRYPGHVEKISFLKQCGLFDKNPMKIGDANIAPSDVLIKSLEPRLKLDADGDILVMRVIIEGEKDQEKVSHTFEIVDFFDQSEHHTAMARTTVFPATATARLLAAEAITEKGVLFPELAFHGDRFEKLTKILHEHNIKIKHTVK